MMPRKTLRPFSFVPLAVVCAAALGALGAEPLRPLASEARHPGGETTVEDVSRNAFSHPAANLSQDRQTAFFIGNSFFRSNWVEAPASTSGRDGLGPHFIARSCGGCHLLDGRGAPPKTERGSNVEAPVALIMRLSIPGPPDREGVVADPVYGTQLDTSAISGVKPEGRIRIRYRPVNGRYDDGTPYTLMRPEYSLEDLAYGPASPDFMMSPRIAPHLVGMGLLEAIREEDLLRHATQQAEENRGVSGRPNRVWDEVSQRWTIGRFGWKANVGSIAQQVGAAFVGDMGITSSHFPNEPCTPRQSDCLAAIDREAAWRAERGETGFDIDDRAFERVVFYTKTLAVPARRNASSAQVRRGEKLFHDSGCASCHVPAYVTGELKGFPELSGQAIWPYTDLLLHDMGEGLADGRPDFEAGGREWRTPPLWGLGLVQTVNGHTRLLHDGRARDFAEAILWHGGEAETAARKFRSLPRADREALLAFLRSL